MAGWSDAEELAILQHYFAGGGAIAKSSYWIALVHTTPPSDDSNVITEPSYAAYARVNYLSTDGWNTIGGTDPTDIGNNTVIQFPECGADATGTETVEWFAIMSLASAGNLLFWGDIVNPTNGLTLVEGLIPQFEQNQLILRLGG